MKKEYSYLHSWLAEAGVLPHRDQLLIDQRLSGRSVEYFHRQADCQSKGPFLNLPADADASERFCPCVVDHSAGSAGSAAFLQVVGRLCSARQLLDDLKGRGELAGIDEDGRFPSFLPMALSALQSMTVELSAAPATTPAARELAGRTISEWRELQTETAPAVSRIDSDLVRYAVRAVLIESLRKRIFGEFIIYDAARILEGIREWSGSKNDPGDDTGLLEEWLDGPFHMGDRATCEQILRPLAQEVVALADDLASRTAATLSTVNLSRGFSGKGHLRVPACLRGEDAIRWIACLHGTRTTTTARSYLVLPRIVAEWLQSPPSPLEFTVSTDRLGDGALCSTLLGDMPDLGLSTCQWDIAGTLLADLEAEDVTGLDRRLEALVTASRL